MSTSSTGIGLNVTRPMDEFDQRDEQITPLALQRIGPVSWKCLGYTYGSAGAARRLRVTDFVPGINIH
jgi:hypothetical protein